MPVTQQPARVLLVSVNREEVNMRTWPLGLACVAEATRQAGHEVRLLDLMTVDDPAAAIRDALCEANPDVIGVSVRNIDNQHMQATRFYLDEVRQRIGELRLHSNAPIVLGGAGYSIFPESALRYVGADLGLPGEGEASFPQLVSRLQGGADPAGPYRLHRANAGPSGPRTFEADLDAFPLPDVSRIPVPAGEFWMPVQTRRGCSLDCSYCSTPAIEGRGFRKRSVDSVTRWLGRCADAGITWFYFVDNTFNLPAAYAMELCNAIIDAGLRITWRGIVYPWRLDERLVERMAAAGCVEVSIGSESGSEPLLAAMGKRFTPAEVHRSAELFARYGVRRMGFLLLGGPGETLVTARESLAFADSLAFDALKITMGIRIYPETELAGQGRADGIIAPEDDLLIPRFYLVPGLEGTLEELVARWREKRPNWLL